MTKLRQILIRAEFGLILFFSYVISVTYVWLSGHAWSHVFLAHLLFVIVYSIFYLGRQFLWFLVAPLIAVILPIETYLLNNYLKKFKQNSPAESVIILGHADWFTLQAWIKPNVLKSEIELLIRLLERKGQDFAFYPNASIKDVESIMRNKSVREVYFLGHGDSHSFQLQTNVILYYCDFNDPKYAKEFVHQVHCGKPHGKSLVDYVVPQENKAECFLFRKPINSFIIEREFKRREAAL